MVWLVEYRFIDNNNRRAETILRLPGTLTFGQALVRAEGIAASFDAVSDAVLDEFIISRRSPGPAGSVATALASVQQTTVLFYREGEQTSSLRLPAVGSLLFETLGPYGGIRITRASAQNAGALELLERLVQEAYDHINRPYPGTFYVGGRDDV